MKETWKDILESKKTWFAILTFAAFVTAHWGFNLDVAGTLAMMTPFGLLLGAQGWADSGPGGAIAVQAKLIRRASALPDAHPAKSALLKSLGVGIVLVFIASGCSASQKTKEHNALTCAEQQLNIGLIGQVAADLLGKDFAGLEGLAVKEGASVINCAVSAAVAAHPPAPAGEGSGSAVKAMLPSPIVTNGKEWLSTHGGAQ